jgi:DNA processing protein
MDAELAALVRLHLTRRVSSRGARRLVDAFGSLPRALAQPAERLAAVRGIGPETARLLAEQPPGAAAAEADRLAALGGRLLARARPGYPARLAETHDPPLLLEARGPLPEVEPAVAVVGARSASPYGLRAAREIALGLARAGVTVVSGLARGVDAAAHRGALEGGGRTIAVLGSGLDRPYPKEHEGLALEIVRAGGALVSELPLGTPPLAVHFPRRNRIVAGLSLGVVVVEAAERSGSLITAEWALEAGREVMAVPARVGDPGAAGCHRLIQEGAALVEDAEDVLAACGLARGKGRRTARSLDAPAAPEDATLTEVEGRVVAALSLEPAHIDEVVEATGLPASTVFGTLTALEWKRAVKAWPGKLYQRA